MASDGNCNSPSSPKSCADRISCGNTCAFACRISAPQ
jgi:hypothetical protein